MGAPLPQGAGALVEIEVRDVLGLGRVVCGRLVEVEAGIGVEAAEIVLMIGWIAFALATYGCVTHEARPDMGIERPDRAVYQTVLTFLIGERNPPGDKVICLDLGDLDEPEAAYIRKAAASDRIVHPGNQCRLDPPVVGVMRHLPSGKEAINYQIEPIRWTDADTAYLSAGYSAASLDGAWCWYRVARMRQGWRIVSIERCIVS